MKYEAPELTALPTAINAIQRNSLGVKIGGPADGFPPANDDTSAYEDWE